MRIIENENENDWWKDIMNWIKNRNNENWNEIKKEKKWEEKIEMIMKIIKLRMKEK
jgi:hypothetical protein